MNIYGPVPSWRLGNPLAFFGILIAYFNPMTKFPHAGHVLLSTWGSVFHINMVLGGQISFFAALVVFVFVFAAVLIPCCLSGIIFPLLFISKKEVK